jgi:predicted ABC-type transport system involved in lysophospholipase L1 biosynthesis ATPase subunit
VKEADRSAAVLEGFRLAKTYVNGSRRVEALRGVDVTVRAGEFVAVVGPSGCGKSTLLHLLGLVDQPSAGEVRVDGRAVADLGDRERTRLRLTHLGFVFQRFYLLPILTALENVELPMTEKGVPKAERRARSRELMGFVGLSERCDHRPGQLSGGGARVDLARAGERAALPARRRADGSWTGGPARGSSISSAACGARRGPSRRHPRPGSPRRRRLLTMKRPIPEDDDRASRAGAGAPSWRSSSCSSASLSAGGHDVSSRWGGDPAERAMSISAAAISSSEGRPRR